MKKHNKKEIVVMKIKIITTIFKYIKIEKWSFEIQIINITIIIQ